MRNLLKKFIRSLGFTVIDILSPQDIVIRVDEKVYAFLEIGEYEALNFDPLKSYKNIDIEVVSRPLNWTTEVVSAKPLDVIPVVVPPSIICAHSNHSY